MLSKKQLTSKAALLVLVLLFIFLADLKFKQYQSQRQISQLTNNIKTQAEAVEKNNSDLSKSFAYLNSPDFKESVARQDMNLKKQGELVYGFTQNPDTGQQTSTASGKDLSNAKKWWDYFFSVN